MTQLTLIQGGDDGRRVWTRSLGDAPSAIAVLNGRARQAYIRDTQGAFSIKWMPKGRTVYRTQGASHLLAGEQAVILNSGQPYSRLEFLDRAGTESFCVFVSDDLVADAWRDLAEPELADEDRAEAPLPQFPDLVFRPPAEVLGELARMRADFAAEDPSERLAAEENAAAGAGERAQWLPRGTIGAWLPGCRSPRPRPGGCWRRGWSAPAN